MKDRYGLESQPTVKDAHSPAGQQFYAPKSLADLPDCPVCKYGTPVDIKRKLICIDCGNVVGTTEMKKKSIETNIVTAKELAEYYKTTVPTVLGWYHQGIIPAAVGLDRVFRFELDAVKAALSKKSQPQPPTP